MGEAREQALRVATSPGGWTVAVNRVCDVWEPIASVLVEHAPIAGYEFDLYCTHPSHVEDTLWPCEPWTRAKEALDG